MERLGERRRRQAIKVAALALFKEKGVDAVTTGDIAVAAGISRTLVYRYGVSKEALLIELLGDELEVLAGVMRSVAERVPGHVSVGQFIHEYFAELHNVQMANEEVLIAAIHHSWKWDAASEDVLERKVMGVLKPLQDRVERRYRVVVSNELLHLLWLVYLECMRAAFVARRSTGGDGGQKFEQSFRSMFSVLWPSWGTAVNGSAKA